MLWLLLGFLSISTYSVHAQSVHKKTELSWQTALIKRYAALRQQTLRLAQQRHWPIRKNYSTHRQLQLQEVDELGQPVYYTLHNTEAAIGTRTQALYGEGALPVTLSGNSAVMNGRLGLWDGGRVLAAHQEFTSTASDGVRVTPKDNAATLSDHATHLAGTLIARGISPQARGMANKARLSVWDYTDDVTELTTAAPNLLISNHAYGPVVGWVYNPSRPGTDPTLKWEWWGNPAISATEEYLFGFYTTKARDLDQIAYNNPFFLMVRSADNKRTETGPPDGAAYYLKNTTTKSTVIRSRNDAYDVIPAEATAKNVLTVGAADLQLDSQNQPTLLGTTPFSGWGPTDDGRIKPDLLGVGLGVYSTLSTSNTAYGAYNGTSMASANVAGSLFLLQELYAQQRTSISGSVTSGQFMRAATLRGLVLHTADRPRPSTGPDYRQGWGLLNTEAAARAILNSDLNYLISEKSLLSNGTFSQQIVAQGNEPLIVTICWTDPEGAATSVTPSSLNNRSPKLINDLDLRISDGQITSFPFVLNPAQPSRSATRGDNSCDNIEQIYMANPVPGQTYTLTVSHKGKMTYASQPFSIIASGLRRTRCQLTVTIEPTTDTAICAGSSLLLSSAAQSGSVYQWLRDGAFINSAEAATYQATQPGSYALRVTDSNGCSGTSRAVRVQLRTPATEVTPTGEQWLCKGSEPIRLKALGTPSARYEWLRDNTVIANAQLATLDVTQPGRYQARVTQAGCTALSAETVVRPTTVNEIDLIPQETTLTLPKGATLSLKAPDQPTYQYQWFRNSISLPNATNYQLSVSQAGTYRVQVKQQNCTGLSMDRIVQTTVVTATTPDPDAHLTIYPNPAESILSIRYVNPFAKQVQVSLFNLQGILQQRPVLMRAVNGLLESNLSIVNLPAGPYILRINDGGRTQEERFLKK